MKVRTEFIVLALLLVFMTGCLPLPSLDQENAAEDVEHTDYLLAYYPFDDSTKDSGKNGYHGVPIGAPSYDEDTPSGSGKALKLNGFKGQYVNVPYPFLNGLNEYSVSFWIKDFGMGMVFSAISSDFVRSDYPRLLVTDSQKFRFYTGYDNYDTTPSFAFDCTPIMASEWHHVVLVVYLYGADLIKELYVDGVLIDSAKANRNWDEGITAKINIGGDKNGAYPVAMSAKFDNFRFYECALGRKDVEYLYQNKK